MSAFKLTREDKRRINDARDEVTLWRVIEGIVASRCPEGHHWTSREEREPTEEDGMKGSTWPGDRLPVFWMTPNIGCVWGSWNDPPTGAVAWLRIPDYEPPVPTPEDQMRAAFEKWVITELNYCTARHDDSRQYVSENVRCAWAAWQAARADAGKPEPVELSPEDEEAKFRRWLKDNPVLTWQVDEARELWKSIRSAQ